LNITLDSITKIFPNFKSQRETEYAMNLGESDDLNVGFDTFKNLMVLI